MMVVSLPTGILALTLYTHTHKMILHFFYAEMVWSVPVFSTMKIENPFLPS